MIKNLKHLIVFILILLLVVLISMAASRPVNQFGEKGISNPINPVITEKWPGLGMMVCSIDNTSVFDGYLDTLTVNGFNEIRIDLQTWNAPAGVARTKAAAIHAIAKGARVIWGVGQWNGINAGYPEFPPISAANWINYRQAILDAAQWAQNNGVYEFQIGNEEELQNDDTTLTDTQLRKNLKSLATEVQAIFTRGNISYSCAMDSIDSWISIGKGDIDLLASNVYMGGTDDFDNYWTTKVADLVNAFGPSGTYITEFAPSYVSLDSYSTDETVQATAVAEMIDYIKASGINRATYFCWNYGGYGVLKDDGTYRQLWDHIL